MNRVILIGNGFDLAHGMKTSYNDFIKYILETEKDNVINELRRTDINSQYYYADGFISVTSPRKLAEIRNINYDKKGISFFDELNKLKFAEQIGSDNVTLKIQYTNIFFKELIIKNDLNNWVDIEYEYYKALMDCINGKREYGINKLNSDFSHVTKALENYLSILMKNKIELSDKILDKLTSIIKPIEVNNHYEINMDDNVLMVIFNYTNLIEKYLDAHFPFCKDKIKCIYIHGQLGNNENKIIFGYGDELDDNYKFIENINDNKYLDNVKSIKYSETDNYNTLKSSIDASNYEVYIMGHSCGISDKTLLNTIFEHKNCLFIKVFYHQINDATDNYSDIYKNISRNFINKQLMRSIVYNKTKCEPLI
ncbi:MAG: bacteriophage abortive infection AbiH family protein [Treponema sp.]|jgi:hypothetical protein|nr:bacteriophage abortive infection AbiH family protein [Treponema sp.]